MKKNILIALIIVLASALIVGGLWLIKNQSANKQQTTNNNQQTTNANINVPTKTAVPVLYVNGNFLQKVLNVEVNTPVNFINQSEQQMQPVSDPHPGHTILPDFDAKRPYKKGEIYTYTFTKPGSYPYHNEVNPEQTALIIVQ